MPKITRFALSLSVGLSALCVGAFFAFQAYAAILVGPAMTVNLGSSGTGGLSSLSDVSNAGSTITFRITTLNTSSAPSGDTLSVNMPAGFQYVSSQNSGDCAYSLANATDNNFRYSYAYSGSSFACASRVDFTYRITSSTASGSYALNILNGSNATTGSEVTVGVITGNSIRSATTIGTGASRYVNSYYLTFFAPLGSLSDLDGLTIDGNPVLTKTASGATGAIVTFVGNTYTTADRPGIGGTFGGVVLTPESVNELDGAVPYVTGLPSAQYVTGSVTIAFDEGNALLNGAPYVSGTVLRASGNYSFSVTDTSLNARTGSFAIANGYETDAPVLGLRELPALANASATLRFGFTDAHYTVGTATGRVLLGTGGAFSGSASYPVDIQTGSSFTGSATLSSLAASTRYGYSIVLTDDFGNTSTATGYFTTATDPAPLAGSLVHSGAVTLTGTLLSSGSSLPVGGFSLVASSYPDDLDAMTGSLAFSGLTAIRVWSGTWSGILYPPTLVRTSDDRAATRADITPLVSLMNGIVTDGATTTITTYSGTPLQTVSVGAGGNVGLLASGGNFTLSFSVPAATVGSTLYVYRSTDGADWQANLPSATCTIASDRTCSFSTDHLTYFAVANVVSTVSTSAGASSGGGGGGGGGGGEGSSSSARDSCPTGDYSPSYYDGKCGIPPADNGSSSGTGGATPGIPVLAPDTLDVDRFSDLSGAVAYLGSRGMDEKFVRVYLQLAHKADADPLMPYYRSVPSIGTAYNRYVGGLALLIESAYDYRGSKDPAEKRAAILGYQAYLDARKTVENARSVLDGQLLATGTTAHTSPFRTRMPLDARLTRALSPIAKRIAERLDIRLARGAVTADEYAQARSAFENASLLFAIYRDHPSVELKNAILRELSVCIRFASRPIPATPVTIPSPASQTASTGSTNAAPVVALPKKTLADVFVLPAAAKYGETSDGIRALQVILKAYGYFPKTTDTTGYFGSVTRDALRAFAREVLAMPDADGTYTPAVRDAIGRIEYAPERF